MVFAFSILAPAALINQTIYGGSVYSLYAGGVDNASYAAATSKAATLGGYLARIDDPAENLAVFNFLLDNNASMNDWPMPSGAGGNAAGKWNDIDMANTMGFVVESAVRDRRFPHCSDWACCCCFVAGADEQIRVSGDRNRARKDVPVTGTVRRSAPDNAL